MVQQIKAIPQEQYAFNVTWHGGQDDPMFTVRASTIEEFRERCALILEGWEAAQPVQPAEDGESVAPPTPPPPAAPPGPTCQYEGCGKKMEWRTGNKDGVPWQGWFCPTRNRAHKAVWA
jgi:hypothetical protein